MAAQVKNVSPPPDPTGFHHVALCWQKQLHVCHSPWGRRRYWPRRCLKYRRGEAAACYLHHVHICICICTYLCICICVFEEVFKVQEKRPRVIFTTYSRQFVQHPHMRPTSTTCSFDIYASETEPYIFEPGLASVLVCVL